MSRAFAHILRHPLRISSNSFSPKKLGLWLLLIVISALVMTFYTRAIMHGRVYAATSSTLNFQARLMSSAGTLVPDGSYSIQFKLYDAISGGTNEWTETQSSVTVKNGYLSAQLGNVTPFGSSIDWSQEKWLTMNVNSDGEMSPRIKLTAVPYSFRSGQADALTNGSGSLTADDLVQLSPSSVQAVNTAVAALRINQTGAGGLLQLQGDSGDVFTVAKTGDVVSTGDATFSGGIINLGAAAQAGGLVLHDGSSNTGTFQTAPLGQNTTYTLPDPGGASATICLSTGNCGGTGDISQGGNAFGQTIVLGSNDANNLELETAGVTRLTLDQNGNATLTGAFTAQGSGASSFGGALTASGLITANGGLTIETGDTLTINGEGFTDLTGNGLQLSGSTLAVVYGSSANSSVQGNTTLVCPSGTGNLSGGGNTITLGGGGTCNALATADAVSFSTSVTTPLLTNSGALILQTQATAGADDLIFQTAGTEKLRLLENGNLLFEKGTNDVIFAVDTPSGSTATYTFSGATGTVLTTANFSGGLDATYVNVGESPASGDISGSFSGGLFINADSVALGTDTTGNYVANLGALTGLSTTGNTGEGSTPTLAVVYGSGLNTAVQGNTTLVCPAGSGNLGGGGNTVTLGSGGTCGNLDTNAAVNFATSVTTPILTSSTGLVISSGGSGDISLNSASDRILIDSSDTSLERIGAGAFTINLNDGGATTLNLNNSGAGSANLNLQDGGLYLAGTSVLTNGRSLENLTGISTTGGLIFNSFGGSAGLLAVDGSGNVSVSVAGTGYEVPLTFNNGLTRTGNVVGLGGTLGVSTNVALGGNNLTFSGSGSLIMGATGSPVAGTRLDVRGTLGVISAGYSLMSADTGLSTYGYFRPVNVSDSSGRFEIGTYDINGASQGGRDLVLNPLGGNVGIGGDLTPDALLSVGSASQFQVNDSGSISAATSGNTINGLIVSSGALSSVTGITFVSGNLNLANGGIINTGPIAGATTIAASGMATIGGGATISGAAIGLNASSNFDTNINTGSSTGTVTIGGGSSPLVINSTNFDVSSAGALSGITTISMSGAISAATSGNTINGLIINSGALSGITTIVTSGNITSGGSYIAGGNTGVTVATCAANQYIGNGVRVDGGVITAGSCRTDANTLSDTGLKENITQVGSVLDAIKELDIIEYDFKCSDPTLADLHLPCNRQVGVSAQQLQSIFPNLVTTRQDGYLEMNVHQLSFYSFKAITELAELINADGNVAFTNISTGSVVRLTEGGALQNITGLNIVSGGASISGGLNNNGGGLTNSGAISGATTINASGAITAATSSNTINGLVINGGNLSSVTGLTFTSGNLVLNNGSISGANTITASGNINSVSGAIQTGNTSRLTNAGALQNITTLSMSGAITAATSTNTINGLVINAGSLTGITGYSQASGAFTLSGSGAINIGGGSNALTINSTNFDVSSAGALSGITTVSASGNINTTGVYQRNGVSGINAGQCGNTQYLGGLLVSGGIITGADICRGVGLSDGRLKENVTSLDDSILNRVKDVNTVRFNFNCNHEAFSVMNEACDKETQTGVIAQELAEVFPELVYQDEFGYYRVKYDGLNIYTLKAVSQLARKVDEQNDGVQDVNQIKTGGVVRLTEQGELQNINGLNMVSGGASVKGGINNNLGGITNTGNLDGVALLNAQRISLSGMGHDNLLIAIKEGQTKFILSSEGAVKIINDQERAFEAQNKAGEDIFSISTSGGLVKIGSSSPDTSAVLLVLDSIDMDGDPPGVNGAQYYNSRLQRFRCFENGIWTNCITYANAEYIIVPQATVWQQPVEEREFPGSPRIWADLSRARDFRITMQLQTASAKYASCFLQYAVSDQGPWKNLAQPGGYMNIGSSGTLKSIWTSITPEARNEVLVRVMCRDGEFTGINTDTASIAEFNNVRLQVR